MRTTTTLLSLIAALILPAAHAYEADDFTFAYSEDAALAGGRFFYQEVKPAAGQSPILIPLNCLMGQPKVQEFIHLPEQQLLLVSYDAGEMGTVVQVAVSHLAIYDLKTKQAIYNDRIATTTIKDYTDERNRYQLRRLYRKALKGEVTALTELTTYAQNGYINGYASYLLGEYWRGRDDARAFDDYTQAVKQGSGAAAFALADYFYAPHATQSVVSQDSDLAFRLYKLAAETKHIDAYLRLAEYYEKHPEAAEADQASAQFWYDEAAEAGSTHAMQQIKERNLPKSNVRP